MGGSSIGSLTCTAPRVVTHAHEHSLGMVFELSWQEYTSLPGPDPRTPRVDASNSARILKSLAVDVCGRRLPTIEHPNADHSEYVG